MSEDKPQGAPREFRLEVDRWSTNALPWNDMLMPLTTGETIHVIEYSAFELIAQKFNYSQDELEAIRSRLSAHDKSLIKRDVEIARLAEELSQERIANARIFSDAGRLTEERDSLRREVEELRQAIRYHWGDDEYRDRILMADKIRDERL